MRRLSAEIQSILHEAREGGSERLEEFFSAPVSTGALKSALNGIQGELSSVVGSLDDLGKRGIRRRKASHVKGLIHRLDKVGGMVREALVEARTLLRRLGEEVEEDLIYAGSERLDEAFDTTGLDIVADAFRKLKVPAQSWPKVGMNRFGFWQGTAFFPNDVDVFLSSDGKEFQWVLGFGKKEGPSGSLPVAKRIKALQRIRKYIKNPNDKIKRLPLGEEVEEDLGDELPCLDEETGSDCWQLQEAVQFVADDMAESTGLDPEVLSAALVEAMSCKSECREKYVTEKGDFKGGKGDAFKTCEKYAEACCTGVKDPGAFCAYIGRKAGKI